MDPHLSTQRLNVHRANALARLAAAWDKRPDLTLGELVAKSMGLQDESSPLVRSGDIEFVERVEKFVLLGKI